MTYLNTIFTMGSKQECDVLRNSGRSTLPTMDVKRKCDEDSNPGPSKLRRHTSVTLRPSLDVVTNKTQLLKMWSEKEGLIVNDVEFMTKPFKVCQVRNFIDNDEFLDDLKSELFDLEFSNKNNDLYQFRQSLDLSNIDTPSVNLLKSFLADKCRTWLQDTTGIELNKKVAVTCSLYDKTDYLLCHDDRCEDRRIAFILYLNRDWLEADGGTLQLFNTDAALQPKDVLSSILPQFNCFVFFEVTNQSFHQVTEVLTMDKTRIAVNGWFHGPRQLHPTTYVELTVPRYAPQCDVDVAEFINYLNPVYLNPVHQEYISNIFENESEILLVDFMNEELYFHICESFNNDNIMWKKRGPAHRRSHMVAVEESLSSHVKTLLNLLKSSFMFQLLNKLTNLELVKTADEEEEAKICAMNSDEGPKCSYEVQKWKRGCYTLINDDDKTFKECGLDATLYFNVDNIQERYGGFTSYIARGADEELLTVTPSHNALALTFRDKETLRFVKYINHSFTESFQTMSFTYYE